MPLLSVQGLHVSAPAKPLVNSLSFMLNKGQTLALVGESGSGKTLSALAVMGLLPQGLTATAKTLSFQGRDLQTLAPKARRALRGKDMAMIFQEPATALNPVLTCGYQVEEAFIIHTTLSAKERKARVLSLFNQVQLPDPERIFKAYPHQISGGQRQRVMIAMALAHKPALLVADEPTTALDVTVQAEIISLVKALQAETGMAMLWITHDFGVVKELADDVVVMQHGQKVEEGPTATLLKSPTKPYTKQLLAATLSLAQTPPKTNPKVTETLLQTQSLSHTYAKTGWWGKSEALRALNDVSLTLKPAETLGIVGESGSGKSTLAKVITRLIPPDADGTIVLMGQDITAIKGERLRQARRNMQMVFQDPVTSLNPKLTIAESIAEGVRAHRLLPAADIPAYVASLLQQVGLPEDAATRLPHQFSGGQRQRIAIARALALQPKLIIADEPVSALDVSVQAQILNLFKTIQKEQGTAFLFISHDLRVISHLAHNVLVMHKGQVVESGPTATIFAKPKHPYTQRLLHAVI